MAAFPTTYIYETIKVEKQELKTMTITITSLREDFRKLNEAGIIKNHEFVLKVLSFLGLDKKIKAGTYELNNHMGILKIIEKLLKGEEKTLAFTIVEGFDLYNIDEALWKKKITKKKHDFLKFANAPRQINEAEKKFNLNNLSSLEGFFYPDTYLITLTSPLEDLFESSLNNFNQKIFTFLVKSKVPREDWVKYMTMASLIEKETILNSEKPIIAGVIFNRLERGMKLRFDPTIIYALKVNRQYEANLKQGKINIKREHFTLKSSYNTYYAKGLPPHPISSITASSLIAAINPQKHDYLFFVTKSKSNHLEGHDFSKTYLEHLRKIEKYLKQ